MRGVDENCQPLNRIVSVSMKGCKGMWIPAKSRFVKKIRCCESR